MTDKEKLEQELFEATSKLYPFLCTDPIIIASEPEIAAMANDTRLQRMALMAKTIEKTFGNAGVVLLVVPNFTDTATELNQPQQTLSVSNLHPIAQYNGMAGLLQCIEEKFVAEMRAEQEKQQPPEIPEDRTIN